MRRPGPFVPPPAIAGGRPKVYEKWPKRIPYTLFFLFPSPSPTRGTKETRATGGTDPPARPTSYQPATPGINGEVKCSRAALRRTPKNVRVPHRVCPPRPGTLHSPQAARELVAAALISERDGRFLPRWFSSFLSFPHNGLSTSFGRWVRVTGPAPAGSLS